MSELNAEQSGGEPASLAAGATASASSNAPNDLVAATMSEVAAIASPRIAPDHEAPKEDPPKIDLPKAEASQADAAKPEMPKAEPFKVEGLKADAPKIDSSKMETPRTPRELLIMAPGGRDWESRTSEPKQEAQAPEKGAGKRRFAAVAAMLVLAVIAGAAGGALATVGLTHFTATAAATSRNSALEASVARIDADVMALKAGLEQTSKASMSQFNKTSDRLDRIEKAQAEPAAKLAKLSEAVDKLRAAPSAAAAKEVTGSVSAPAGTQALPLPQASTAPKTEVGRLPTVSGWVLRDVGHGSALIEGRQGLYEVYAGDPVPGLGRVDAIRKQDGRWVVVTSKGLIVAR